MRSGEHEHREQRSSTCNRGYYYVSSCALSSRASSTSRLVPLPSHLLQITEITRVSPLHTPYVIQHQLASPQPNLEHLKTSPERIQPHATNLAVSPAHPGSRRSTRLLKNSLLSLRYI